MNSNNPLFMTHVYNFEKKCDRFIKECNMNDLYMSKHFFERAVERNLDSASRFPQFVRMIKELYISFKHHTYNEYSYKVMFKDLVMIAEVRTGTITQHRRLVIKTIWDSDRYGADFSELIKIT